MTRYNGRSVIVRYSSGVHQPRATLTFAGKIPEDVLDEVYKWLRGEQSAIKVKKLLTINVVG